MSSSNLPSNVVSLIDGLKRASSIVTTVAQGGSQHPFLKLSKAGEWIYGAEDVDVQDGSKWAINPLSLAMGYACWGDGELLGESMAPVTDTPVDRAALPILGREWKGQVSFQLKCLTGDDAGQEVLYKSTSVGGSKAFKTVLDEILAKAEAGDPELVPVVELKVDSYKHKKFGRVYIPQFLVHEWTDMDTPTSSAEETPKAEEVKAEEEPKRRRRRAAV